MSIEIPWREALDALRKAGIPVPDWADSWITLVVIVLILLQLLRPGIRFSASLLYRGGRRAISLFYSYEDKDFIRLREVVVGYLEFKVNVLNSQADWNDRLKYTPLEAEVEVDPAVLTFAPDANRIASLLRSLPLMVRGMFSRPAARTEKDLVRAILHSRSRVFLVIGEAGSGKTVSLRHLFLDLATRCQKAKHKSAKIPLYLNLRHLAVPPEEVSTARIREWVLEQLLTRQDREIHRFFHEYFDDLMLDGSFFFIFDSFDEIPAVMDAGEDSPVLRSYTEALQDFLWGPHRCKGVLSSRPYRAPKAFVGQQMTIQDMSFRRLKRALIRYLPGRRQLALGMWRELTEDRTDLLHFIRTPFYLDLLTRYIDTRLKLPERQYELYEDFVSTRAAADEERLVAYLLTPEQLLSQASRLAYAMTETPGVGLQATLPRVQLMLPDMDENEVSQLTSALNYTKLGEVSRPDDTEATVFGFVVRRFQEYFAARYLHRVPGIAPFEDLVADNRWREVLVLLCEVVPADQLTRVFDVARRALTAGQNAYSGTGEHWQAVEALRFLRDGFLSRREDIPDDVRSLATRFIARQFENETVKVRLAQHIEAQPSNCDGVVQIIKSHVKSDRLRETLEDTPPSDIADLVQLVKNSADETGWYAKRLVNGLEKDPSDRAKLLELLVRQLEKGNRLDQKRAVESIMLADEQSMVPLLETALGVDSAWVQETALRSCRAVNSLSEQMLTSIRRMLFDRLLGVRLLREFAYYRALFSSPETLAPLRKYTWLLAASGSTFLFGALIISALLVFSGHAPQAVYFVTLILFALFTLRFAISEPLWKLTVGIAGGLGIGCTPFLCLVAAALMVNFAAPVSSPLTDQDAFIIVMSTIPVLVFPLACVASLTWHYPQSCRDWLLWPFMVPVLVLRSTFLALMESVRDRTLLKWAGWMVLISVLSIVLSSLFALALEHLVACDYSLRCVSAEYSPLEVLLTYLFVVLGVAAVLFLIGSMVAVVVIVLRDFTHLRYMSLNPSARPSSVTEAIEKLRRFKLPFFQARYVSLLKAWLPVSSDWRALYEAADDGADAVREQLYQLVEHLQDAQRCVS